ncbi:MAG: metallophosphoesterase [Oscillospiraceae bacterium]
MYITGDTHGNFLGVKHFCEQQNTTTDDIMIILGDAGLNYYNNQLDTDRKKFVSEIPTTLFCIHGNHEMRPHHISSYKITEFCGGKVYKDNKYPNQLFAIDGEIYTFGNKQCLVVGGAYSVDKYYRLERGYGWFDDEQPSDEIKHRAEEQIKTQKIDIVLSHTCPFKYIPREWFLSGIDQSTVDTSTEKWLDSIEDKLDYKKWYCGHYHGEKRIDKMEFMFNGVKEFN